MPIIPATRTQYSLGAITGSSRQAATASPARRRGVSRSPSEAQSFCRTVRDAMAWLYLLRDTLAKETPRPEEEDQNQNDKGHQVLVGGIQKCDRERLGDPQEVAAQH